jgi:beta-lactamase regulating signal transducer with metallopeptidase domain
MSAIAQALTSALLHFIWQGMVVAFLLWVALFALRKRSAQARYLAALAALEVLAALPVVTAVRVYRAPSSPVIILRGAAAVPADIFKAAVHQAAASGGWLTALQTWALPLWSLGVLFFAFRAVWGCGRISLMRRRAKPASSEVLARVTEIAARMGLTRPAQVLMTALAGSPSVVGWFRPVILLPAATLLGLTQEQLEAVLAHELAHIRRYDSLVNAAQILLETVLFYHPAVWWTSARIREERELCCDDLAVSSCGNALCYARALARLERLRVAAPPMALGSASGPLGYRIRRLMSGVSRDDSPSKLPGVLALALGLVCLAANVHWARGQEQKTVVPQTPPVVDTQNNRVLIWNHLPPKRDFAGTQNNRVLFSTPVQQTPQEQDAQRAELEALRQRVRELEAQLNDRTALDLPAQIAENAARKESRFAAQKADQEAQLEKLRSLLAQMREKYTEGYPEIQDLRRRIEQANADMMESEYQLTQADKAKKFLTEIQSQRLAQMQAKLSASGEAFASQQQNQALALERLANLQRELIVSQQALSNWTVKSIDIEGLSGEARDRLLASLPVKVGGKLGEGSVDAIARTLKKFDEHLTFTITLGSSGEATIHISTPKL